MKTSLYIIILLSVLAFHSCSPAEARKNNDQKEKPYLVSAEAKDKQEADDLKREYGIAALYIKNGFTAYRITYNTKTPEGKDIVASGAIFIPDIKSPLPLLNYNHGTYFPSQERNAPSYLGSGDELNLGKLFSAAGYLVVMPDYIGYGATKKEKHPYGAYHLIAGSVIDMLKAVKEFCIKNDIELSGKNFYSGWSEGAGVALATVKSIEENNIKDFKPTSTILNAGPYYTSGFSQYVIDSKTPLRHMASYIWILQTYNRLYNINKPLKHYFSESAAEALKDDPQAYVSRDPKELFNPDFRESFKAGKETDLQNALLANDLWDWKPKSRIVFCHGDKDEYVPIFNSEKAYNAMKEKGADVTLHVFKGATHKSSALGYVQQLFGELEKSK